MTSVPQKWGFGHIAAVDPTRASILQAAPSSDTLVVAIVASFRAALAAGSARLGLEESGSNKADVRAVLQLKVGVELFDWFFNATTGYRAQFFRDWKAGLAFNSEIIAALREVICAHPTHSVKVQRLNASFGYIETLFAPTSTLSASLEPSLSKIWFCTLLMRDDTDPIHLPLGLTGPRLEVAEGVLWAAPSRDEKDTWLDVKGAFLSVKGPYQPKDPVTRARRLHSFGDA